MLHVDMALEVRTKSNKICFFVANPQYVPNDCPRNSQKFTMYVAPACDLEAVKLLSLHIYRMGQLQVIMHGCVPLIISNRFQPPLHKAGGLVRFISGHGSFMGKTQCDFSDCTNMTNTS